SAFCWVLSGADVGTVTGLDASALNAALARSLACPVSTLVVASCLAAAVFAGLGSAAGAVCLEPSAGRGVGKASGVLAAGFAADASVGAGAGAVAGCADGALACSCIPVAGSGVSLAARFFRKPRFFPLPEASRRARASRRVIGWDSPDATEGTAEALPSVLSVEPGIRLPAALLLFSSRSLRPNQHASWSVRRGPFLHGYPRLHRFRHP